MSTKPKNEVIEPCGVCLDAFTSVVRKEVSCPYCAKGACSKCIEKYLMNTIEDPHCMHCRRAWTRSFLTTICTRTFLNQTYFKYRQDILLNRQKSFLPQFQMEAERELKARTIEKEDSALAKEFNELYKAYHARVNEIQAQRNIIYRRAARIRQGLAETAAAGAGTSTEPAIERAKFVRRCTADGCKGFLSSVWKCGLCLVWVCPDCFEVKGQDKDVAHTCNPDMLETAKLIKKDTKPCPTCGEMIMKTEGCDQMWCTGCHNAFSWITGKVVTGGIIHNPHYFQWMAQRGGAAPPQNPGNIPCGGLPDSYYMRRALNLCTKKELDDFMNIYRICTHIIEVERHRFERHLAPNNNNDIGVKYMMNDISEDDWKTQLARRERDRQKSNEIRDVLDAFNGATIDLFRRIDATTLNHYTKEQGETLIRQVTLELNALREFTTEALCGVSKGFGCSVPLIMPDWTIKHGKHTIIHPGPKRKVKKATTAAAGGGAGSEAASTVAESDSE